MEFHSLDNSKICDFVYLAKKYKKVGYLFQNYQWIENFSLLSTQNFRDLRQILHKLHQNKFELHKKNQNQVQLHKIQNNKKQQQQQQNTNLH